MSAFLNDDSHTTQTPASFPTHVAGKPSVSHLLVLLLGDWFSKRSLATEVAATRPGKFWYQHSCFSR